MSRIGVDLEQLEDLVARMAAFEDRFEVVHADVERRMQQVRAVWTGAAALEQDEAHVRWAAGAQEMAHALVALRSIAATARSNYASAMRTNLQMWAL